MFKYNPFEWPYIRRYKQLLKDLRTLGRTQIMSRIKALQEGNYVVDDLITLMVKNNSKNYYFQSNSNFSNCVSFIPFLRESRNRC